MELRWKITHILNIISIIASFLMIFIIGPQPLVFLTYIPWAIAVIITFIIEKRETK